MYIRKKELGNNINFNNFIYLDLKGSNYRNDFDRTIRFFNEPCFLFFFREKFYTIKQESKFRLFSVWPMKKRKRLIWTRGWTRSIRNSSARVSTSELRYRSLEGNNRIGSNKINE